MRLATAFLVAPLLLVSTTSGCATMKTCRFWFRSIDALANDDLRISFDRGGKSPSTTLSSDGEVQVFWTDPSGCWPATIMRFGGDRLDVSAPEGEIVIAEARRVQPFETDDIIGVFQLRVEDYDDPRVPHVLLIGRSRDEPFVLTRTAAGWTRRRVFSFTFAPRRRWALPLVLPALPPTLIGACAVDLLTLPVQLMVMFVKKRSDASLWEWVDFPW